jgi:hypothetical protein
MEKTNKHIPTILGGHVEQAPDSFQVQRTYKTTHTYMKLFEFN